MIPLPAFQTIMVDYGLPLMNQDTDELLASNVFTKDAEKQVLVDYKKLIKEVTPKEKKYTNSAALIGAAIKIQKVFRGYMYRKRLAEEGSHLSKLGDDLKNLTSKRMDGSKAKKDSEEKEQAEKKKAMTKDQLKADQAKKKEAHA